MEQRHRNIIRDNHSLLVTELEAAVDAVCLFLYRSLLISKRMMENILEDNNTSGEKAAALLDQIVKLSPPAFDVFYFAILESELYLAADILKPIKAPHRNLAAASRQSSCSDSPPIKYDDDEDQTDSPTKEVLPDHSGCSASIQRSSATDIPIDWPQLGVVRKEDIKVQAVKPNTPMYQDYFKSLTPLGQLHYYTMKSKDRGRVVIINNVGFLHPPLAANEGDQVLYNDDRTGSSCDKDNLEILFQQLGFTVTSYDDQTKENMEKIFQEECDQDHSQSDCFILIILTHGQRGVVFGNDGYSVRQQNNEVQHYNYIKVTSIKNMFCGIRSLTGKPKLFFIQACRGGAHNEGVEEITPDTRLESGDTDMDFELEDLNDTLSELEESDDSDGPGRKIPEETDYLLAMSTVAGKISWRNSRHGSWFIQALVHIFGNYAHLHDLNRLMTLTNMYVTSAETAPGRKQVAEKRDTLRKLFCFFPGLHPALPQMSLGRVCNRSCTTCCTSSQMSRRL